MRGLIDIVDAIRGVTVTSSSTFHHREMLDQVLIIFDIVPDYDLNLIKKIKLYLK